MKKKYVLKLYDDSEGREAPKVHKISVVGLTKSIVENEALMCVIKDAAYQAFLIGKNLKK